MSPFQRWQGRMRCKWSCWSTILGFGRDPIRFVAGRCGGGIGWRPRLRDTVRWYWQLQRFTRAPAMIDGSLNFNQNGARSIFREVNRLISQALPLSLPPSHSPLLFPRHMTTSDTGTPFVSFPSAPYPAPFPPPTAAPHPTSHPSNPSHKAYPTIIWKGSEHQGPRHPIQYLMVSSTIKLWGGRTAFGQQQPFICRWLLALSPLH